MRCFMSLKVNLQSSQNYNNIPKTTVNHLFYELYLHIFSFLDVKTLNSTKMTQKSWTGPSREMTNRNYILKLQSCVHFLIQKLQVGDSSKLGEIKDQLNDPAHYSEILPLRENTLLILKELKPNELEVLIQDDKKSFEKIYVLAKIYKKMDKVHQIADKESKSYALWNVAQLLLEEGYTAKAMECIHAIPIKRIKSKALLDEKIFVEAKPKKPKNRATILTNLALNILKKPKKKQRITLDPRISKRFPVT